ncbi:hypothetical protein LINPERHAP2_LOCUS12828 [Linum perenne]
MPTVVHSPLAGDHKPKLKNGRTPLQPKNSNSEPDIQISKPSPKPVRVTVDILASDDDKENHLHHSIRATPPPPIPISKLIQPIDSSLAEELSAMRKRMERLRLEREKTEKMLKEREMLLDLRMKELQLRGEAQMMLELEVDRLYRLKELHSYSMRISPIRSLRDKEQERRTSQCYDEEEVMEDGSSRLQRGNESPCCSSTSSNSISTPMAAVAVVV